MLSDIGALFLQYAEPFAKSFIEHTACKKYDLKFILKYFLSELCMAAFVDPENGDTAEAANGKLEKQLHSWLRFSINPPPLLKYRR